MTNYADRLVPSIWDVAVRLREYRSALITAAVTGELDLREHEKKMEALA